MRRWLVTLALAVVALPNVTDARAEGFRVDLASRTVTTSRGLVRRSCEARVARLPASVELDAGSVTITTPDQHTFKHALGRRDGLSWVVTVGPNVVIGFAAKTGGIADSIVAIDHRTGRIAWRRSIDSNFAAELVGDLLAVERAGNLDIINARSGKTLDTTPIAGQSIVAVCRPKTGELHLKTRGELVAIDRGAGSVLWTQPTTSHGNPTITQATVIDAWVDRTTHRFGIVSYDRATGKRLDSIDLGATGGWYDYEQVIIAPDGVNDVLVSAAFGVE